MGGKLVGCMFLLPFFCFIGGGGVLQNSSSNLYIFLVTCYREVPLNSELC